MRLLCRLLAPLVSATVLLASALPCPPEEPISASGGESARWEQGETRDARPPLALDRRCPCSCHEKGHPASSGGHLGFALALAEEPEPPWDEQSFRAAPPRADPAPQLGIDPVPV